MIWKSIVLSMSSTKIEKKIIDLVGTGQRSYRHGKRTAIPRKTTIIDDKLVRHAMKLAKLFHESVSRKKNKADNVDASQLQDQTLKFGRDW